jgi:uncharacterized protein (TIGR02996 family)
MSTEAALLNTIRQFPADDTARLVYADYLDELGGRSNADRAEFIRLQTRLASPDETDHTRDALEDRENELLRLHEREWLGKFSAPLAKGLSRWKFERGFVSRISINTTTLANHGNALFARHPLAGVRLDVPTPHAAGPVERLAKRAWWDRVSYLRLGDSSSPSIDVCEAILTAPHLTALRRLTVSPREDRGTSPRLPDILSRGPWIGGLEDLRVCDWTFDAAELVPVLDASAVRRVRLSATSHAARVASNWPTATWAPRCGRRSRREA